VTHRLLQRNEGADLGGDPLASVDITVEVDGRLGSLATTSPEVNTKDVATLRRVSDTEDLGVGGERALQVVKEGDVICVCVVRVKPRCARDSLGRDTYDMSVSKFLCIELRARTHCSRKYQRHPHSRYQRQDPQLERQYRGQEPQTLAPPSVGWRHQDARPCSG